MPEVTGPQAAKILSVSLQTVHRRIDEGSLSARQEGTGQRRRPFIEIDELRRFAEKYGYRLNEAKVKQYTSAE
jgi:hypothetical protein